MLIRLSAQKLWAEGEKQHSWLGVPDMDRRLADRRPCDLARAAVRAMVWLDVDKEEHWALHSRQQALAAWSGILRATNPQIGAAL